MKLTSALRLGVCVAVSPWISSVVAQTTGTAPQCCGLPPIHDSSQKSMVGTAVNSNLSHLYFTGYEGNVSEIYYPTVDTLATANMEFLVGDTAKTFVDEEKLQSWTVTQPDPKSMRWQAVTSNASSEVVGRIVSVTQVGDVASVYIVWDNTSKPNQVWHDLHNLIKVDGIWKITNKTATHSSRV